MSRRGRLPRTACSRQKPRCQGAARGECRARRPVRAADRVRERPCDRPVHVFAPSGLMRLPRVPGQNGIIPALRCRFLRPCKKPSPGPSRPPPEGARGANAGGHAGWIALGALVAVALTAGGGTLAFENALPTSVGLNLK